LAQSDPRDDQALIEAANRGEVAAFEALYYRYRDWVVRLAWRFTGNREDALDVLQETFAYLLRKLPRLRLTARMTTFLYPAVKNLSLAIVRKRKRLVFDEGALRDVATRAAEHAQASRAELAAVLAGLPEAQREVVLMRFVDDMSLREIAVALRIPLGTVKSRLHNALKALRDDERTRRYFQE
jgi:RNA polymerase sigma-70 factor (ECF subfamily)